MRRQRTHRRVTTGWIYREAGGYRYRARLYHGAEPIARGGCRDGVLRWPIIYNRPELWHVDDFGQVIPAAPWERF